MTTPCTLIHNGITYYSQEEYNKAKQRGFSLDTDNAEHRLFQEHIESLQARLNENRANVDSGKFASLEEPLLKIKSIFDEIKKNNPEIQKLIQDNAFMRQAFRGVNEVNNAAMINKIDQARHVFLTLSEYKIIGKELEKYILQILNSDEISVVDKYKLTNSIKRYFGSMNQIAMELEKEFNQFLSSDEPVFKYFKEISAINDSINIKVRELIEVHIAEDLLGQFSDTALSDEKNNPWILVADVLKIRAAEAESRGRLKRRDQLLKKAEQILKKKPSIESMRRTLKGLDGDSNKVSFLFEAMMNSSDMVISAFRKKLEVVRQKSTIKIMDEVEKPIYLAFKAYIDALGGKTNDLKEMSAGLVHTIPMYHYNNTTKTIDVVNQVTFKTWHNISAVSKRYAEWYQQLDEASDLEKRNIRREIRKWELKTFQQEFKDSIYEPELLLTVEAHEQMDLARTNIDFARRALNELPSFENEKALYFARSKWYGLARSTDEYGHPKTGDDLKIAESIAAYRAAKRDLYEKPTPEAEIEALRQYEERKSALMSRLQKNLHDNGDTVEQRDHNDRILKLWQLENERREIHQEFWDERERLMSEIKDIRDNILKDPKTKTKEQEDNENKVREITRQYKDQNYVIQGEYVSESDAKIIKELQEETELIKSLFDIKVGMSVADALRLDKIIKKYELFPYSSKSGKKYTSYLKTLSTQLEYVDTQQDNYEDDIAFVNQYAEDYAQLKDFFKNEKPSKEDLSAIKDAHKRIQELYEELDDLQVYTTTSSYTRVYDDQFELFYNLYRSEKPNLSEEAAIKFFKGKFEDLSKTNPYDNTWYRENHFQAKEFNKLAGKTGAYVITNRPIAIWQELLPKRPEHMEIKPAYFYIKSEYKEEHKNKSQEVDPFTGKGMPRRGGEFDLKDAYAPKPHEAKALNFLINFHAQQQNKLESNYLKIGYAVPATEKRFMDRLAETDPSLMNYYNAVKRKFKTTELDTDEGLGLKQENPEKLFSVLPVQFSSRTEEENFSYDIWGNMVKFGSAMVRRDQWMTVFDEARDLLEIVSDDDGGFHLQDPKISARSVINKLKGLRKEENVRAKAIEETIRTLMFNEYSRDERLGNINFQKWVGNINAISALNTLTWNVPSSLVNWMSMRTQNIIETYGADLINTKQFYSAHKDYAERMVTYAKDSLNEQINEHSFESRMLNAWGAIQNRQEEFEGRGYNNTKIKQLVGSSFGGHFIRQATEFQGQAQFWLAAMKSQTVILKDGRKMNLLNFYEMIGKQHDLLSIETNPQLIIDKYDPKKADGKSFTAKDEINFKIKIQRVNARMNGEYEKVNKSVFEKSSLGASLSFFRKYLVPFTTNRLAGYSQKRYNIGTEQLSEGFYITAYNTFIEPFIKDGVTGAVVTIKDALTEQRMLTPDEAANLRKFYTETIIILTLFLLIAAIGDDGEDLKKHSFSTLYLLYFMKKVKSEAEQVRPLAGGNEIRNIIRTPSIAFNQLAMYSKIFDDAAYIITGNKKQYLDQDRGFWKKDDTKLFKDLIALSTGFRGNTFYPDQLIKGFHYGQRNR